MEISEPSVITRLPLSQSQGGRTLFSPVYGLKNGMRRKRQEICAAVDGHSLNIHEINSGRTLSSCPIPPDTTLCCAPYSLRSQTSTNKVYRSIYFANKRQNDLNLSIFREEVGRNISRPLVKHTLLEGHSPVAQLEILPGPVSHKILAIREDGHFDIYDEQLTSSSQAGNLTGLVDGARLGAVRWLSPAQASSSVLKSRPDVVIASEASSSFIVAAFHVPASKTKEQEMQLSVWQIDERSSSNSNDIDLKPLLDHKLPFVGPLLSSEQRPVEFTSKDTKLVIKTTSKLYTYDLTPIVPRRLMEMSSTSSDQHSSLLISDALTLLSTSDSLQLLNSRFSTLLSKIDFHRTGVKRKRSPALKGNITFISYFPQLNRALAVRRRDLLAIDLQGSNAADFNAAAQQSSFLINNIGRAATNNERSKSSVGRSTSSVGTISNRSEELDRWQKTAEQLEALAQCGDVAQFETVFLEDINKSSPATPKQTQDIPEWKAGFVISKMIKYSSKDRDDSEGKPQHLELALPAKRVLEALAAQGLLSLERIERALGSKSTSNFEPAKYGLISRLLIENDGSLKLLHTCLMRAPYMDTWELCATILQLLRRAMAQSQNNSAAIERSMEIQNVQGDALKTTSESMTHDTISADMSACLCVATGRLAETARDSLSSCLRRLFNQRDIIALIQFLRQQLFHSGFTRSLQTQLYPSLPVSESGVMGEERLPNESGAGVTLDTIASTLSACIDAIGPMGIISFGDEEAFVQTLISELSSEVARATEAVQEGVFLHGMLRETLRFAESTYSNRDKTTASGMSEDATRRQKTGTIVTLYSESMTDGLVGKNTSLLPLGLQGEGKISQSKVGKGHGSVSRRSEREMGMLQERFRGPYSLERLVL